MRSQHATARMGSSCTDDRVTNTVGGWSPICLKHWGEFAR